MYTKQILTILLLTATVLLFNHAQANPVASATNLKDYNDQESYEEVSDLNVPSKVLPNDDENSETLTDIAKFPHHDEDQSFSLDTEESPKNDDVEIIESREISKENIEIEERFRGPALKMNTANFLDEDIEVHSGEEDIDDDNTLQQSHLILSIILVVMALVSIGLYAALVIWRSNLEQRYGMRELLVTHDDDEYCHQTVTPRNIVLGQA